MKKILLLLVIAAVSALGASAGVRIKQTLLPTAAQEFMDKYFPSQSVKKVEKDKDRGQVRYEVDYYDGAEIEFTADGTWLEVKALNGRALPAGIVPQPILDYVGSNHPGRTVNKIERKTYGYEIELSDGIDLKLTADGGPVTRAMRR